LTLRENLDVPSFSKASEHKGSFLPLEGTSAMKAVSSIEAVTPDAGPGERRVRIQASSGFFNVDLASVWEFRELLYFLIWRDVRVRYKQTLIGTAWTVLQPLLTMVVFTVIFGNFARISSDGVPYSIFALTALLPWTYFSQAISRSGISLVNDSNLVKKVYFPRLMIPLAGAAAPIVDFLVSFVVLFVMMIWYRIPFRWSILTLPLFLLIAVITAIAVGLWLAPLNARYRDIGHAIPFLTQFWMFASPVVYSVNIVPEKWRLLYGLNPMVGVIEGFRWALLGKATPAFGAIAVSLIVVTLLIVTGSIFFRRMERTLADVL
jgi:lipopolysaccharide transport system permease protein